ncbi:MAG: FAD-dependent monooxygenase [Bryobacteraceae bacterium]|nr:FAD-dependent monooxygenase [Bryobacteraceae bacterium]
MPERVLVVGGGLAGSAAAIAAQAHGASVTIVEKSRLPRHKVCGEFLSPRTFEILRDLGVADAFHSCRPALMRRVVLNFAGREKRFALPAPAYGLSRYALDELLLSHARSLGATLVSERPQEVFGRTVLAYGRTQSAPKGNRLFGFKAHFAGEANDAVELYFFGEGYVGVNPVEGGITNVCGLALESVMRQHGFDTDTLIASIPALRERVRPLTRQMDWLRVGPVIFSNRFRESPAPGEYRAGDALSFVDPFTGSGMLGALLSGQAAGLAAATGQAPQSYQNAMRQVLGRSYGISGIIRWGLRKSWAPWAAQALSGRLLFAATRP